MKKNNRKKSTNIFKRAFTLVELVVTIAIIAVLSGVAVAGYFGYTNMAKKSVADAESTQIKSLYNIWSIDGLTNYDGVFEQIDGFKDYLISTKTINEKYNATPNINYYVEADSIESNYKVTMFYTSTKGNVAEFEIKANASDLTGQIDIVKSDYENLTAALSGKTAALSHSELDIDALQYVANSDGDYEINYNQYYVRRVGDRQHPEYTEYLDGLSVYSSYDEIIKENYLSLGFEEEPESFVEFETMMAPFTFMFLNSYLSLVQMRVGQKLETFFPTENKIIMDTTGATSIGTGEPLFYSSYMINHQSEGKTLVPVNNYDYVNPKADTSYYSDKNLFISFKSGTNTPISGNKISEVLTIESSDSRGINVVIKPDYSSLSSDNLTIKEDATVLRNNQLTIAANSFSDSAVTYERISTIDENVNALKTITVASGKTLTVQGTLSVGASLGYKQPETSILQNLNYAEIKLEAGAKIVVDGGTLNCYGKISGEGTIEVINGGKVIEPIAINDWRGGQNATATIAKNIFPFLRYDVNNISCPITFDSTSNYTLATSVVVTGMSTSVSVSFIGDQGMFNLASGKVTKEVNTDGKMEVTLSENAELIDQNKPINVSVGSIDITKVAFPISNIVLNIGDGCSATFSHLQLKVLPTSTINVKGTGTMTINENATVAVYDDYTAYEGLSDSYVYNVEPRSEGSYGLALESGSVLTVNGTLSGNVGGSGRVITGANAKFTTQLPEGYKLGDSNYVDTTTLQPALVGTYNDVSLETSKEYPAA